MANLYAPIEARHSGRLVVSAIHSIYWEESGASDGIPVVFVHGGPGAGTEPSNRRYFDPSAYRIVLFDQRGAGRSTPHACLEDNTTWRLVEDMERLRQHLEIERWVVFGGSWGSTLSLVYAQSHPERVLGLILRGIFTLRPRELQWFYQGGAAHLFPDAWERFLEPIPEAERNDLLNAYHRRLTGADREQRMVAARAWSIWEASTSKLRPDTGLIAHFGEDRFADAFARIEAHYFVNRGFFRYAGQVLDDVERIRHLPGVIVQGRYDVVCPMTTAWELHQRWPEAALEVIGDAGHSASEPGIADALVRATDRFSDQLSRSPD